MKIYEIASNGIRSKEVKMHQVVFWRTDGRLYSINYGRSDLTEDKVKIVFMSASPGDTIFLVKPGGLERDAPSKPSTVKLTVYGAIETTRQKVV